MEETAMAADGEQRRSGASITVLYPTASAASTTSSSPTAAVTTPRARIEAAFESFNAARHEVYRWTPGHIAERWARFAHECSAMLAASGVPERFRTVDLDNLNAPWLPD